MQFYTEMNANEARSEYSNVLSEYEAWRGRGLSLDMSRGKPGPDQMDISSGLFSLVSENSGYKNIDNIDCRNYGGLDGLSELKSLFADILEVEADQVLVGGNSSLNMMFDTVSQGVSSGFSGEKPWLLCDEVKFLCPVPGYDRHFAICEYFGIKMINIPCDKNGPIMDIVEEYVKDPTVKGMWCVPKYSNPEGIIYSDDTVKRIASLKPAAKDFRVFWDNAYALHHLGDENEKLLSIYDECKKHDNEDMVFLFTSTSKITFPGAGVAAEAASPANVTAIKNRMSFQTIGPDKLNQLRHARKFLNKNDLKEHMMRHAKKLHPKFEAVIKGLKSQLSSRGIASWTEPNGGYFISLTVGCGLANRIVMLCKDAGLVLTPAGATYPYGKDPLDNNIRIAPSYPLPDELELATSLLCVATRLATLEKMLQI